MNVDLRITLQKLDVLTTVVRLGGVSRAADALFVSQPVISAHIRSLSQRLGVELFYREGRTLRLTEAGEAVARWAEDTLTRTRELDPPPVGPVRGKTRRGPHRKQQDAGQLRAAPVTRRAA